MGAEGVCTYSVWTWQYLPSVKSKYVLSNTEFTLFSSMLMFQAEGAWCLNIKTSRNTLLLEIPARKTLKNLSLMKAKEGKNEWIQYFYHFV